MNNKRVVHTKLYTKASREIAESVFGQLSDGWGENSNSYDKYWRFADVKTASDGETVIEIDGENEIIEHYGWGRMRVTPNGFKDMSDAEVLAWLAKMAKKTARMELKDDESLTGGWDRANTADCLAYLSYNEKITVAETYFVYEWLMGRSVLDNGRWSDTDISKYVGTVRSAETTKRINELQKSYDKAYADFHKTLAEKQAEMKKKIDEYKKALEKEYEAEREAGWNKVLVYKDEIDKLAGVA